MVQIPVETKPAAWGAVGGAVVLAVIGFTWGGWVTHATAEGDANQRVERAVVSALAPICAEKFRLSANAVANLAELKKADSWKRGDYVAKGGWATLAGSEKPVSGVADACATLIENTKI